MTTVAALAGAARDARVAWTARASAAAALFAIAALAPLVLPSSRLADLADGLYLALAAVGLAVAVGLGGMPSLGQGAFMAVGAFTAAQLRIHGELPPLVAALAGAALAAAAGAVTGAGVVFLRRGLIAVATWIFAWLVALGLAAFPSISGGSEGLLLPSGPGPETHYELALALVALAALGFLALARSPFGLRLQAARDRRPAAAALGVPVARLRLAAFVASAAVGGLAGGLAVQSEGVADASSYTPFLSFKVFVAVLIGGATAALGPVLGASVLGLVSLAADALGDAENVASARYHPLLAAVLLLAVLSLGGEGILRPGRRRHGTGTPRPPGPAVGRSSSDNVSRGGFTARGLGRRYGELVALDALDLDVAPGTIVALIGPNGSGKTTALRLLAGAEPPDAGTVEGKPVRTLQATGVYDGLTALEHLLVGSAARRRFGGFFRSLLATPKARAEEATAVERAREALARFGLADRPAGELSAVERRLLMIASAHATGAGSLLLDEPSAGASAAEVARLGAILRSLREEGFAVLVVEHNLRLVRAVADRVIALDAGRVIAAGTPAEIADDRRVREAYLGRQHL